MTQELSDFALGFVKGCANKNMTVDQMLKAAMHASDNIPGIKSELQPLLTMDKEAGKWNPKNVWGGAKKVWTGIKDIPGWFASKFNKNIDDVPTPAPPARDPTFSDPTPASPPRDLTFNDVPEPPEHLQEMLRIPNPTPPPSPGVPNPVPPPKGNIFINRQTLNSPGSGRPPKPVDGAGDEWVITPQEQTTLDNIDDILIRSEGDGDELERLVREIQSQQPKPQQSGIQHFLQPGPWMENTTRAEQWDFLRNNPDMGKRALPLEIDMQDYYKGRDNWYTHNYNRLHNQVDALNKPANPQLTGIDKLLDHIKGLTPRQQAMMRRLEIDYGQPLDALQKQWDEAAVDAVSSGRRMDPGDVPSEVGDHMHHRAAENRARQAELQDDYTTVYEQLLQKDPAEAEAFRKMHNMMKKLKEMGAGQPAPGDLRIPPPSSHPQVRGKQGMANVKLALDMFRDGRSLNAQQ